MSVLALKLLLAPLLVVASSLAGRRWGRGWPGFWWCCPSTGDELPGRFGSTLIIHHAAAYQTS